jgi:DNA polymerase
MMPVFLWYNFIMDKEEALNRINTAILALEDGELVKFRRENNYVPVPGEGPSDAKIMLIGEAPGKKEAETGKPFVGAAGKLLNSLLEEAGISRDEVFITSIVKDRPPKNRDPRPDEIALYAPFLDRQIEVIRPKVIATLGRFSMVYIMERYGIKEPIASISELHGTVHTATMPDSSEVTFIPLFHPAAAIYNQKLKDAMKEDFKALRKLA